MDIQTLSKAAITLVEEHWPSVVGGAFFLVLGRTWGRRKAMKEWRRREFKHRLMVSLSSIHAGQDEVATLAIRTLFETDLKEVFQNDAAVHRVVKAAADTSDDEPIVMLDPQDRWHLLKAVLNAIAERYSVGALACDMGVPVVSRTYVACLTRERSEVVKTDKVRAMVVRKDHLLSGRFDRPLRLESDSHAARIHTLRRMRELYQQESDLFLDLVISLPASAVSEEQAAAPPGTAPSPVSTYC